MINTITDYRGRVMGCWLGKAVGGTLGMPFEGQDGPLDVDFYTPVPTEMLPNDDLDLQVLWACVLDREDPVRVSRHVLARAWRDNCGFPWDEYGVAKRNLAEGLAPPLSGSWDNWFTRGMGAAIRSEVWACLAPGDPALAAKYAYEDACVDHAGEGIWAEVFFAALESAAFVQSDPDALLDLAEAALPADSEVRQAVHDTRRWWRASGDWRAVREKILKVHGHENFTDIVMNVAFTVLGWLAGKGDFSRAICLATNCGKDTDCTAATVGALMGILDPQCIPERWLAPIGRDLVLSPEIVGITAPKTLEGLTDLVLSLRERLNGRAPDLDEAPPQALPPGLVVEAGFLDALPDPGSPAPDLPPGHAPLTLPGTVATLSSDAFHGEVLHGGISYDSRTPDSVVQVLYNCYSARTRVAIHYGYTEKCPTADIGRDWLEEHDVTGTIGASMGPTKIPLMIHNRRSMGGGGILTASIVKIRTTGKNGRTLYQHPQYHTGAVTVRELTASDLGPSDRVTAGKSLRELGYTTGVYVNGKNQANFKSPEAAARYLTKMALTVTPETVAA